MSYPNPPYGQSGQWDPPTDRMPVQPIPSQRGPGGYGQGYAPGHAPWPQEPAYRPQPTQQWQPTYEPRTAHAPRPGYAPPQSPPPRRRRSAGTVALIALCAVFALMIVASVIGSRTGDVTTAAGRTPAVGGTTTAALEPPAAQGPAEDAGQAIEAAPPVIEQPAVEQPAAAPPVIEPPVIRAPVIEPPVVEPAVPAGVANAVGTARNYLDFAAFSRSGLIDQLEFEGYSNDESTRAVDSLDVDWNAQAAASAENYLSFTSFSRSGLVDQLEFEGFTPAQAEHGVSQAYN